MINYFILHSFEQQVALQENPVGDYSERMDTVENKEQKMIRHLPNYLTVFRIILVPVFLYFCF